MNSALNIFIIEDDPKACENLKIAILQAPQFNLLGITNNAYDAYNFILTQKPDVLILDIELHLGGGDGTSLLVKLKSSNLPFKPFILVTTNNLSITVHNILRKHGADFILSKSQEGYSADYVVQFISTMKDSILSTIANSANLPSKTSSSSVTPKSIEVTVHDYLNRVGISPKAKGYDYLTKAIMLFAENPQTNLCNKLATIFGKSAASIERAMQNAISRAWIHTPIETLSAEYSSPISLERGCPTLMDFISYYATKIKDLFS